MASSRPDLMPNFPPEGHDTQEAQENQKVVHGTKRRKYERKTKRFLWSDDLHQLFIAAIFDIGLKAATPKGIHQIMGEVSNGEVTTEHLKSHLQKYRTNSERSKKEFLAMYEKRMEASSAADSTNGPSSTTDDPKEDDSGKESKSLNPSFSTYPIGFSTPVAANKSSFKSSKMENSLPLLPNDRQLFLQTHQRQQALMELQNKLNVHFQEQSKLRQELQFAKIGVNQVPAYQLPSSHLMNNNYPIRLAHVPFDTSISATPFYPLNQVMDPHSPTDSSVVDTNSQMAMHLVMQNQMNLHRQMLLQKDEISQHASSATPYQKDSPNQSSSNSSRHSSSENQHLAHAIPVTADASTSTPSAASVGNEGAEDDTKTAAPDYSELLYMEGWDKIGLETDIADDELFGFLRN